MSWNALLHFLRPCWLGKVCHSHPQPHPGLVITELLFTDVPRSSIPLVGHRYCFSSSLLPCLPWACSLSKASCPGSLLDHDSSLQPRSHLNFLTPFPSIHRPGAPRLSILPLPFLPWACWELQQKCLQIALQSEPLCLASQQPFFS